MKTIVVKTVAKQILIALVLISRSLITLGALALAFVNGLSLQWKEAGVCLFIAVAVCPAWDDVK